MGEISAQINVGYNSVDLAPDSYMPVLFGDLVGWYMPDWHTIPFNAEGRHLLVRGVYGTQGQHRNLDMSGYRFGWC